MQQDAARRRQALEQFMQRHGLNRGSLARQAGISPNIIYNFLKGQSAYLSQPTLEKIAATFGVKVAAIVGDEINALSENHRPGPEAPPGTLPAETVLLPLVGEIQGNGVWSAELYLPVMPGEQIACPIPALYAGKAFAVRLRGPSMNQLFAGEVTLACVPARDYLQRLTADDIVIMVRQNSLGLFETTVKQYVVEGSHHYLAARSTDPRYAEKARLQAPLSQPLAVGHQDFFIQAIVLHYSANLAAAWR